MNVIVNEKLQLLNAPTITTLIEALKKMEAAGVDTDSPLVISHLENALGTFAIYELNK